MTKKSIPFILTGLLVLLCNASSVFASGSADQYIQMRSAIRSALDSEMQQTAVYPQARLMYGMYPMQGFESSFIASAEQFLGEALVSGAVGKVAAPVTVGTIDKSAIDPANKNWAYLNPQAALAALLKSDNDLIAFTTDSAIFTSGGKATADDVIVVVMNKQGRLARVTTCNNNQGNPYMLEFLQGAITSVDDLASLMEAHFRAYYPPMIQNWKVVSSYLLGGGELAALDCEHPVDTVLKSTVIY